MSKFNDIVGAGQQQMTIDEYLALDRDESPQVITSVANSGAPQRHETGTTLPGQWPISPEIGPEFHNGFEPGASVGHVDYSDFRAVYVGPGRRPGQAKVKVVAGWTWEVPKEPVTIPYSKLTEVN